MNSPWIVWRWEILSEVDVLEELSKSIILYDEEGSIKAAREGIKQQVSPIRAIRQGVAKGLKEVGDRFEKGEIFLPELMMAAGAAQSALKVLLEHIPKGSSYRGSGRVIIGTVQGDIHDIGKNIVSAMLRANGFEVIDLGTDVPAQEFARKVKELKPDILGLSALLTTTLPMQKEVISTLENEKIRQKVKVIIGGTAVTDTWANEIGADAIGRDANDAVQQARKLVKDNIK